MLRHSFLVALSAALLAPTGAYAQDDPDAPPTPDAPGAEADVDVERPTEVARIQGELERIKRERASVMGEDQVTIRDTPSPKGGDTSPVLAPRREVVHLTLHDAIADALANNPDYLVQLLAARAAHDRIDQEQAAFDPVLSHTGTYSESRDPSQGAAGVDVIAAKSLSLATTLAWRVQTGTQLSLTWTEARRDTEFPFVITGSRALTPSLQFSITQPLLRGFGIGVNTAARDVAENSALSSDAQATVTYMAAVLGVEQAYWELVRAEEELRFQERSLSSSLQFLADQRKRWEHGAGTELEVTIAKAGVAQRREAVIVSENALEAARDQIVRLTRPSGDPSKWDLFVVPVDLPKLVPEPELDPAAVIQTALERRPDYWQGLLALDSARRNLQVAENSALPAVNLIGSWTQSGLGRQHHSAWTELTSGRFYTWSVGLQVELPLVLRAERARVRAAKHDLERAEATLAGLEATVVLEVRRAIRDTHTSKARIEAARANRILAKERLDATREMLKAGTAVPRDVLDDLAGLAQAEGAEVQAFINYRLSLTRLRQAQGTLLDDWLEGLAPRIRRALDRER